MSASVSLTGLDALSIVSFNTVQQTCEEKQFFLINGLARRNDDKNAPDPIRFGHRKWTAIDRRPLLILLLVCSGPPKITNFGFEQTKLNSRRRPNSPPARFRIDKRIIFYSSSYSSSSLILSRYQHSRHAENIVTTTTMMTDRFFSAIVKRFTFYLCPVFNNARST